MTNTGKSKASTTSKIRSQDQREATKRRVRDLPARDARNVKGGLSCAQGKHIPEVKS
jgi:hypothetical protein